MPKSLVFAVFACLVSVPSLFALGGRGAGVDGPRWPAPRAIEHPSAVERDVLDEINWARAR